MPLSSPLSYLSLSDVEEHGGSVMLEEVKEGLEEAHLRFDLRLKNFPRTSKRTDLRGGRRIGVRPNDWRCHLRWCQLGGARELVDVTMSHLLVRRHCASDSVL